MSTPPLYDSTSNNPIRLYYQNTPYEDQQDLEAINRRAKEAVNKILAQRSNFDPKDPLRSPVKGLEKFKPKQVLPPLAKPEIVKNSDYFKNSRLLPAKAIDSFYSAPGMMRSCFLSKTNDPRSTGSTALLMLLADVLHHAGKKEFPPSFLEWHQRTKTVRIPDFTTVDVIQTAFGAFGLTLKLHVVGTVAKELKLIQEARLLSGDIHFQAFAKFSEIRDYMQNQILKTENSLILAVNVGKDDERYILVDWKNIDYWIRDPMHGAPYLYKNVDLQKTWTDKPIYFFSVEHLTL